MLVSHGVDQDVAAGVGLLEVLEFLFGFPVVDGQLKELSFVSDVNHFILLI